MISRPLGRVWRTSPSPRNLRCRELVRRDHGQDLMAVRKFFGRWSWLAPAGAHNAAIWLVSVLTRSEAASMHMHRRVRARKLRQRRWRCVTGAADRRRRDRWLCPCQLRAGELCAVRGKAPLLTCPGAASRRGLPFGGSTRFYGGFNSVARSSGPAYWAAAAVRGLVSSSGRLSLCFPDDEAPCCGYCGPALRAARSRLTAIVVSAGHMPGPVGQAGAAASFRLRIAGPAGPCRVSLDW